MKLPLPFSLFLAFKYLKPKRTLLSVATVISMLGVTLGVAVLLVVIAVMSGFDEMWRDKILSFNAHILIQERGALYDPDAVIKQVKAYEGVTGAAPFIQGLVFIQHDNQIQSPFARGVDPEKEGDVSQIPSHMKYGAFELGENQCVMGRHLAFQLGVDVGDQILVYSPQSLAAADEFRLPEELTISGVFELGMYDFDMGYVLTSLETARTLYDMEAGVHAIQVMTENPYRAYTLSRQMQEDLGPQFVVQTWMDLNQQLFSALRVEKNLMFFILIFIVLVAAFGITSTLINATYQKTREIGLLKSLGFSSACIMRVFLWQSLVEGVAGISAGLVLGSLALRYRNDLLRFLSDQFNLELLPAELYQLSEIPASIHSGDVVMIAGLAVVICLLAGIIPAMRAAMLDPVKALRYE